MLITITGHTHGLGLEIANHMRNKGHTIIGYSRSNGYSLPNSIDIIVDQIEKSDLFFNNAHCGNSQALLLRRLYGKLPIITSGSIAAEFAYKNGSPYYKEKLELQRTHHELKRLTNTPMLLLRMGYLPNFPDKWPLPYSNILESIDFWLKNMYISLIEFENNCNIYKRQQ